MFLQIAALTRIRQYVEDPNLPADDQQKIRLDCLRYWDITDARQQHKLRLLKQQQLDKRARDGADVREDGEADEDTSEQEDEGADERVGYVHYDPQWGLYHFSRHPQQGLFTLPAAEHLLPQLDEQLQTFRPLEPLPSAAEDDAYRRRQESQHSSYHLAGLFACYSLVCYCLTCAPLLLLSVSGPSSMRQFHSLCDHRWQCMVVPTGGVHTFILATPNGLFILDDRMQPMPLPRSYHLSLPPDTVLEALLYPAQLLLIDCWALPSPSALFPSHLWMAGERSTAEQRLQEVQLLLEAVRARQGGDSTVRVTVSEVRKWAEVSESDVAEGMDVLFVREEGKRPSVIRYWDGRESGMQWSDVQRLMREVTVEKERARQKKADRLQKLIPSNGDSAAVMVGQ